MEAGALIKISQILFISPPSLPVIPIVLIFSFFAVLIAAMIFSLLPLVEIA